MLFYRPNRNVIAVLIAIAALWCGPSSATEISSYAGINADGSLRIKGKTIHLYGIHIPDTGKTCSRNKSPPVCGSRAVVALDFKIDGFVRCEIVSRNQDGSLVGWCRVKASHFNEGEDLSAYLLQKGWAVALPDASIEYQTLEKIARSRQFGVWGTTIDSIGSRP
jgi:endonuclease YncB( thermonuclease family)